MLTAAGGGCAPVNSRRFAWKYSSIDPCRSRWSWLRFVKTSASKRTRSRRRSAAPCELASIATLRSPASSISRKSRCRSIASGVVCGAGRALAADDPLHGADEPGPPAGRVEDRAQQKRRRRLPVRPGDARDLELPRRLAEEDVRRDGHRRPRVSTTSCGTSTSSGRSTTSATAPSLDRLPANSCPSTRAPRTQKKSDPVRSPRASYARSLTSTGRRPITSTGRERPDQRLQLHVAEG